MWSPASPSCPYGWTPNAAQGGGAPNFDYVGYNNQSALMWAFTQAKNSQDKRVVIPAGPHRKSAWTGRLQTAVGTIPTQMDRSKSCLY